MTTSWLGNLAKKVLGLWTQSLKEPQKMRMTQVAQMEQGQKKLPQVPQQMRAETQQQQAVRPQQQLMHRAHQDAFDLRAAKRMEKQCGLGGLLGESHCPLTWFLTEKNSQTQYGHQMMKMMKLVELKQQKIPQQKTRRRKKGHRDK